MAYAAGAKILKDAGETVSDVETQLSQALVEVETNAQSDLKEPLRQLYFKVTQIYWRVFFNIVQLSRLSDYEILHKVAQSLRFRLFCTGKIMKLMKKNDWLNVLIGS